MMSAKKATIGLLKINVFYDKDYGIIVSVHDIICTILSCDSDYNAYTIIIDNTYTLIIHIHLHNMKIKKFEFKFAVT